MLSATRRELLLILLTWEYQDDIFSQLLLNLKPAAVFKQAVTKQEKTLESCGMLRNTCLTHSTSQQVNWQQVKVSWMGLKGHRVDWAEIADGHKDILLGVQEKDYDAGCNHHHKERLWWKHKRVKHWTEKLNKHEKWVRNVTERLEKLW